MARQVGVPGVAVDQADAADVGRHPETDRKDTEDGGIAIGGKLIPREIGTGDKIGGPGRSEGVDADADQGRQLPTEVLDVDAGTPVHLRRELARQ